MSIETANAIVRNRHGRYTTKLKLECSANGTGDWPEGLISHAGGTISDGFIVYEVWESKAKQEAFMAGRLGAALGAVGVPQPRKVTEVDIAGHYAP